MSYLVTGATGFIGRHLVSLLAKRGEPVYVLLRRSSTDRFNELRAQWDGPVEAVFGDLAEQRLGISDEDIERLAGNIRHMFHLAALYDMTADAEALASANIQGTRNAIETASAVQAGCFHHVSSIAAAGRYRGLFREDMFEEATELDDPYFRTKHDSEGLVRTSCAVPWRIYRPGVVVGHSGTGEMDKIDGPYYFFKLIQKLRNALPPWLPLMGIQGGPLNIVPVDFVAAAMDVIAHKADLDGGTFHLVDPKPKTVGESMNIFARAAHAPEFAVRVEMKAKNIVPPMVRSAVSNLPPIRKITDTVLDDIGVPRRVLRLAEQRTEFDCRETERALAGTSIMVPPLESYAAKLWDYWERNMDPDLFRDHSLRHAVEGKRVLITGASAGIGRAVALKAAAAGARVLLVARSGDKLNELQTEIEAAGGNAHVHTADLSDNDSCDALVHEIVERHGGVDVLVNNAGRSIRRSLAQSSDRFHDFQRTMQLNYFGALKLILGFLPGMTERKLGHIINVSSIGAQTNPPRFSAYVASKAALDAFSRCAASELVDDGIAITTVYMPLVKTEMIAPTKIYRAFPTINPDEAAEMICDGMIDRPKRISTRLGVFGEVAYAAAPKAVDVLLNQAYKLFPESAAAGGKQGQEEEVSSEAIAFAHLVPGVHW